MLLSASPAADASALIESSLAVSSAWFAEINPEAAPQRDGETGSLSTYQTGGGKGGSLVDAVYGSWFVQLSDAGLAAIDSIYAVSDALSLDSLGATLVRGLGLTGLVQVTSSPATDPDWFLDTLTNNPLVAYVEADLLLRVDATPNDPRYGDLWGLHNTGQTGGTPDADIDAPEAWNITTGSASVVVAVIDTGVDYRHRDLAANMWRNPGEIAGDGVDNDGNGFIDDVYGWDFVGNDADPMDANGHGTHVAGTIAADGHNGTGVVGVNWSASIMALRFLDASGSGSTADAIRAINYATMMRADYGVNVRVLNNSWGGGGFSNAMYNAINASRQADILFVAAAGNSGYNNDFLDSYPASYNLDNVIAVAATSHRDNLASFSQYGLASVDLAAPGVDILSTTPGDRYASFSGTSMATPHVSGVAALGWAFRPGATYTDIRNAIFTGVDHLTSLAGKLATGGRLNARGTLAALDVTGPVPPPPPPPAPPPGAGADAYEDNDSRAIVDSRPVGQANSPNLGLIPDQMVITGLNTLDDPEDWYRFEMGATGTGKELVRINFSHSAGDLDLELRDAAGNLIVGSYSVTNNESVSLNNRPEGVYYVRVYGYQGARNPDYTLTINSIGNVTETSVALGGSTRNSGVRFVDADGTLVTLGIKRGQALLHFTGEGLRRSAKAGVVTVSGSDVRLSDIRVTASNGRTRLQVQAKGGDGRVAVDSIAADAVIKTLKFNKVDVHGDVSIGGARRIQLGDVTGAQIAVGDVDQLGRSVAISMRRVSDSAINSLWRIERLAVAEWIDTGGERDHINAPTIRTLVTTGKAGASGDFMADVTLIDAEADLALRGVSIAGVLRGARITALGGIGSFTADAIRDSRIMLGVEAGRTAPPTDRGHFVRQSRISSVSLRGAADGLPAFVDSDIAAWRIGPAKLRSVLADNAGDSFGLTAVTIDALSYIPPGQSQPKPAPLPSDGQAITPLGEDFFVRLL